LGKVKPTPATVAALTRALDDAMATGKSPAVPEPQPKRPEPTAAESVTQAEATWGEAVEGVQCRVRAEKPTWPQGALPKLFADLRNQGKRNLRIPPGETTVVEFVRKTGQPIIGQLTGLPKDRLKGAFVCVTQAEAAGNRRGPGEWTLTTFDAVTADDEGRFTTARISPGTYTVVAESYEELGARVGVQLPDFIGTATVTVLAEGKPPAVSIPMKPREESKKTGPGAPAPPQPKEKTP
jgi:hypothetical protein